jgi:hypothetical protein
MLSNLFPYPKKKIPNCGAWNKWPPSKTAITEKIPPPEMRGLFGVGLFLFAKDGDSTAKSSSHKQSEASPVKSLVFTKNYCVANLPSKTHSVPKAPDTE